MRRAACSFLLALASFAGLSGQETHLVLVAGLSGEKRYAEAFHAWLSRFSDLAETEYGVRPERIVYLGERAPAQAPQEETSATLENLRDALLRTKARMAPPDALVVLLAGHGTSRGEEARFNLPGPDLSPQAMAELLLPFDGQGVTFVNASSSSGAFLEALRRPGRTVVTATRSGGQIYYARFGMHFVEAFAGGEADQDMDERVSIWEAFEYAGRQVGREYERAGSLRTEIAVLDDGEEGALAKRTFLAGPAKAGATEAISPRARALLSEKAAIEERIAELKSIKGQLEIEVYEERLEELLVELALKVREIRAAREGGEDSER